MYKCTLTGSNKFVKLMFWALALCQNKVPLWSGEGHMCKTPATNLLQGFNLPFITFKLTLNQIMHTKSIYGQVLINTLDWYPWLALYGHSINTSLTPWLTPDGHSLTSRTKVIWELTNFWLINMNQSTLGQLSTNSWSSVDRVSIEILIECTM